MRYKIIIILVIATRTVTEVCDYENSVVLTNRSYNNMQYNDGEYFMDNKTGEERGCVCMKEICARKCCPSYGQLFDTKLKCVDHPKKFDPPVWDGSNEKPGFNAVEEFHFILSRLNCSKAKKETKIKVSSFTDVYHLTTIIKHEKREVVCEETCTRKWFPSFGQIFDPNLNKCFDHSRKFNPSVWDESNQKHGFNAVQEFHVLMSGLKCSKDKKESKIVVGDSTEKYHLTTDGQLYIFMENSLPQYQFIGPDKYCIDNFLGPDNSTIKLNALMCYVEVEKANSYVKTASCMLVSCFFIILTISVYAFLPDLRSTTHGMIMITYLSSFFVTFLFMATMQLQLYMKNISQIMCTSMTFIIYYSALAAFFWMNVMCYDLWWKFRIVHVASHGVLAKGRNRFVWYSVYAFGIPLIFTILVAALEFSADLEKHNKYLPNIRVQSCFIDGTSKWIYLYSPMMLICIINLVMFILVALRIAHIKKQTQRLKKKDTQRFTLYIKLFIITGINWILEAISEMFPDIYYLWSITDVYNVLIGFIIFVIFVCKKKIFIDIQKRYKDIGRKVDEENQPSTTLTSMASQSPEEVQMESNISNESIPVKDQ